MLPAPIPIDENERIADLYSLNILDTPAEEQFDRITRISALVFDVPMAVIALVDSERLWFKSTWGYESTEIPRDIAFCGHTIYQQVTEQKESRLFEVVDASADQRFYDNPLVTGDLGLRYYLGYILQGSNNKNIGTLALIDKSSKQINDKKKNLLIELGAMTEELLLNKIQNSDRASQRHLNYWVGNFEDTLNVFEYTQKITKSMHAGLKERNFTFNEWRVLNEVIQHRHDTSMQIGTKLNLSPPQMSQIVDKLEHKLLLTRDYASQVDRRIVKLKETTLGNDYWQFGVRIGKQLVEQSN